MPMSVMTLRMERIDLLGEIGVGSAADKVSSGFERANGIVLGTAALVEDDSVDFFLDLLGNVGEVVAHVVEGAFHICRREKY
jgi:hypothetical protein